MLSSLKELNQDLAAINRFVTTIAEQFELVLSIIGRETLFFVIALLFFSAILSALAIPKGRLNFLLSMLFCDYFWITWHSSFYPESSTWPPSFWYTNMLLALPFVLIQVAKIAVSTLKGYISKLWTQRKSKNTSTKTSFSPPSQTANQSIKGDSRGEQDLSLIDESFVHYEPLMAFWANAPEMRQQFIASLRLIADQAQGLDHLFAETDWQNANTELDRRLQQALATFLNQSNEIIRQLDQSINKKG